MARVNDTYPAPIHGVSTLAPRNRGKGQARLQENMRSDPVAKLTRRPAMKWLKKISSNVTTSNFKTHHYRRDEKDFLIIVKDTGEVQAFINDEEKTVTGSLTSYVDKASTTVMTNVNDTTFVVNTAKKVLMHSTTDSTTVEGVSYVNILSALNYGETVSVDIKIKNGGVYTVSHTVPDLGSTDPDYDAADKARATKKVAEDLASKINALGGITAKAKSSTIAIWEDAYPRDYVHTTVQTGQGDRSAVVSNKVKETISGLPQYAVMGTRITIAPDPTSDKGTYFLQAEATDPTSVQAPSQASRKLEEVVWVESRDPTQPYSLNSTTLPHTILYNISTDDFTVGIPSVGWDDRIVGNDKSNRVPSFVNNTIDNISFIQKRLVLLSDNSVVMSKTNDIYDFWKASANTLLVTDPIDISSSVTGIDKLKNVIPHNRDLLILAANAQFKITGTEAITPLNASMQLTTTFESQTQVAPVAMGNSVFFPTTYGESTGIHEYTAQKETTQDEGFQITHHIIGYMAGNVRTLSASPNLEMLAVTTTEGAQNEVYIYEQFTLSGKKTQLSWSKWLIPEDEIISEVIIKGTTLDVLVIKDGELYLKRMDMYNSVNETLLDNLYLDNWNELTTTNGNTVTLPTDYIIKENTKMYRKDNTTYKLFEVPYTQDGSTITLAEDIREDVTKEATVVIGENFESKYSPTRPFTYVDGLVDTHDSIRVNRFVLNVVDSHEVIMEVTSDFYDTRYVEVIARKLGLQSNRLGTIPFETGDWKFPYKNKAALADATFKTSKPYNLTIAGISWDGQVHRPSKRL